MENKEKIKQIVSEIKEKLERDGFAVAGSVFSEEKMGPLPQAILDEVFSFADVVLVEADGSKRMPLKMPRQGEPVLPETCDFLVTVAGLSALGQPWEQVCHRFALVSSMFSGKTVAEGDIFPLLQKIIPVTLNVLKIIPQLIIIQKGLDISLLAVAYNI